jgi:hypothetical protein
MWTKENGHVAAALGAALAVGVTPRLYLRAAARFPESIIVVGLDAESRCEVFVVWSWAHGISGITSSALRARILSGIGRRSTEGGMA